MQVFHASSQLASIRSVDEAVVIGVALSLSSSAFVLQLLAERGETNSKFGSATLGILLMQARQSHTSPLFRPGWEQSDQPGDRTLRQSLASGMPQSYFECCLDWTWHGWAVRPSVRRT